MLSFFIGLFSFFQVQSFDLTYFSTQSGLSNNIVYDVYQDHQGYIWVATENGLNRFDAYNFEVFSHELSDSTSISSNIVRTVFEDRAGNLWIGTQQGLDLFERESESFIHFEIPESYNLILKDIQDVKQDYNDNFWFLIGSRLFKFDPKEKEYTEILVPGQMSSASILHGETVWISTYDGRVLSYSIHKDEWLEHPEKSISEDTALFSEVDDSIIWGSFLNEEHLPDNFKNFPLLANFRRPERILEDSSNRVWVGTTNGIFLRAENETEFKEFELGDDAGPLSRSIKAIFEDKVGSVWIGTLNGLFRLDPKKKQFESILNPGSNQMAMAIEETQSGVWVNYFNNNLSYFEYDKNKALSLAEQLSLSGVRNQIWDINTTGEVASDIWLGTEDGLLFYDEVSKRFEKIPLPVPDDGTSSPVIFAIAADGNAVNWVGGYERIYELDTKTKEILSTITFPDEYPGALVQDILVLDDELFIATERYGLFVFSKLNGLEKWSAVNSGINDLIQTSIWDLYKSRDGKVWIGSKNGLFSLEETTSETVNELNSSIVFSVTEDFDGILWLGTEKGLIRYDPESKKEHKITSTEYNRRSIFTSGNGNVFIGGMEGVIYFDPSSIRINQNVPDVWITDFTIVSSDSIERISLHEKKEIELSWEQNTIEIDFTALNYTESGSNQYAYQLIGRDPVLVESNNVRKARYVQLPPGEYEFHVIGSNNDNIWNTEGASLRIIVYPPFWKTIWFRALILILLLAIVWSLYTYRVKKLLEIERVRLRIASDLHDEIGSGLSGIALAGDLFNKESQDRGSSQELAGRIATNARKLASSLDSIVWLIDPSKESVLHFLQKCKQTARELLANKEIKIIDNVPESYHNLSISSIKRRNMYLIFKETVHNALKHSNSEYVEISFDESEGLFKIVIEDSGIGFDEKKVNKGYGLESIRRRAEEMKSNLEIISSEEAGTKVILSTRLP
ncbi:MAG: hypothetical protein BalsKO_32310 [Balneolaceae bacterium]